MDRKKIGTDAEQHAEQYLLRQRLKLITRNYRCRFGEIDLIMQDGGTLVFVEVRLRHNRHYGGAAASVTHHKQSRIIKTASLFLSEHPKWANKNCRFDVIAFEYDEAPSQPLWYKDAFRI